jgi:hypothetical protein
VWLEGTIFQALIAERQSALVEAALQLSKYIIFDAPGGQDVTEQVIRQLVGVKRG